jgi:hypothetical protein
MWRYLRYDLKSDQAVPHLQRPDDRRHIPVVTTLSMRF